MILFKIRNTTIDDLAFYRYCLDNLEFKWNLYNNDRVNLEKFLLSEESHLKFFISKVNAIETEDIGFCHFYYNPSSNEYCFIGGTAPKYFNSGIGLYASVAVLSYLFRFQPSIVVNTGVYVYNQRSLRMLYSIGFDMIEVKNNKFHLKLTLRQFQNYFVYRILDRIKLQGSVNPFLQEYIKKQ